MKRCIICNNPVEHPLHDFCDRCFHSRIDELQERYGKKEGPSSAREDIGGAPASEPSKEDTASYFVS